MSTSNSDIVNVLINLLKEHEKQLNYIEYKVDKLETICTDIYQHLSQMNQINSKQPSSKNKKILIIDDDEKLAQSYKLLLESEGHTITIAKSGLEALRILKRNSFEVVILDWNLPDMLGDELSEKIVNDYGIDKIIFITGYSSIQNVSAHGSKFLQKPVSPEELINEVNRTGI